MKTPVLIKGLSGRFETSDISLETEYIHRNLLLSPKASLTSKIYSMEASDVSCVSFVKNFLNTPNENNNLGAQIKPCNQAISPLNVKIN